MPIGGVVMAITLVAGYMSYQWAKRARMIQNLLTESYETHRDAFVKAYDFLTTQCNEQTYSIIGYELRNTLSDNGSVSRGRSVMAE